MGTGAGGSHTAKTQLASIEFIERVNCVVCHCFFPLFLPNTCNLQAALNLLFARDDLARKNNTKTNDNNNSGILKCCTCFIYFFHLLIIKFFACPSRMLLPWSWWWLLLLLGLLPLGGCSRIVVQDIIYKEKHSQGEQQTPRLQQVLPTAPLHLYGCDAAKSLKKKKKNFLSSAWLARFFSFAGVGEKTVQLSVSAGLLTCTKGGKTHFYTF